MLHQEEKPNSSSIKIKTQHQRTQKWSILATAVPHSKRLHHDPATTMQSLSIPQKTEQKSATPLTSYAKKTSQLNNARGMPQVLWSQAVIWWGWWLHASLRRLRKISAHTNITVDPSLGSNSTCIQSNQQKLKSTLPWLVRKEGRIQESREW